MKETVNCSVCGASSPVKRAANGTASAKCPECGFAMMFSKKTVARFDELGDPAAITASAPPAPEPTEPTPEPKKNGPAKSSLQRFYDGEL